MADPTERAHDEDEDYDEEADEDFSPETIAQDENLSSSEDDLDLVQAARPTKQKRKRGGDGETDEQLDSGDEATIKERHKKRRKGELSDDEGGEGGFVKTRSQRRNEQQERGTLATTNGSTVDVDALWSKLSSLPIGRPPEPEKLVDVPSEPKLPDEEYITIKRTTKFAGEVTTETRQVLKSSKEAQIYLEEQEAERKRKEDKEQSKENTPERAPNGEAPLPLRRPLRRPSRFEPNPLGEVKTLPPHLQLKWPRDKSLADTAIAREMPPPRLPVATKLNVVQKSRHDWAGYVDKAGIAEELDDHGKSKRSYLARSEFLNRMEDRREAERRDVRLKG